ncbi:hypothetical protein [Prosthecomicrobium sp. N25]|uniref:hypothetical protein n=1 Tax=Prosthecomicrobium sp. N25 TaxID=3129254 RepID=UPI003077550D
MIYRCKICGRSISGEHQGIMFQRGLLPILPYLSVGCREPACPVKKAMHEDIIRGAVFLVLGLAVLSALTEFFGIR